MWMGALITLFAVAVGILLGWGLAARSDRKHGEVLVRLDRSWQDWPALVLGTLCFLQAIPYGAWTFRQEGKWSAGLIGFSALVAVTTGMVFLYRRGPTLRRGGIVTFGTLVTWQALASWSWQDENGQTTSLVIVDRKAPGIMNLNVFPRGPYSAVIPLDKKPLVEEILGEKIGKDKSGEVPQR